MGKKNKALREKGLIPAVVYGSAEKSQPIEIELKNFEKVWREAGESSLIDLEVDGDKKNVLIKEVRLDPVSDKPTHADFYAVRMDKPIQAMVPIEFIGESPAVKNQGAILVKVAHELEVEALPANLPPHFEVDVSSLEKFDDRFLVKDLKLPEGVKVFANPEDVIALAEEPKAEEETPPETPSIEDIEVVGKKGKEEEEGEAEKETAEKKPESKKEAGKDSK